MKILELYSGIGGMHFAFKESNLPGEVLQAIDINTVANSIYQHNFPGTSLLHKNIQGLTSKFINSLNVDTILMSPPCQPFSRNGLQKDVADERTNSFKHILKLLPTLTTIDKILVENVKFFEKSKMRDLLIESLSQCGFSYQEFLLSPTQFGIPNSRLRYYCIAKKQAFSFPITILRNDFPMSYEPNSLMIEKLLERENDVGLYYLSDKTLIKYLNLLDICFNDSKNSCCFTKAYTRYVEGTGSVFTNVSREYFNNVFQKLSSLDVETEEYLNLARSLKLRYFTPKEVYRLMSFPENFSFPDKVTDKQKYMVLGNSLNIKVVSELIKLL